MKRTTYLFSSLLGAALLSSCSNYGTQGTSYPVVSAADQALEAAGGLSVSRQGNVEVLRGTGNIQVAVDTFRTLVGATLNPNTPGQKIGGRREINWDGVPAALTNIDTFPANFFNARSARGALFITGGTGLRVSDNGFGDINAAYSADFKAFSPTKTFAPIGSTVMEVHFVVAGSDTAARVNGFGAVFSGADRSTTASIDYYDGSGTLLGTIIAPRRSDVNGLSFAGVIYPSPVVAFVRIHSGQAPLSASTGRLQRQRWQPRPRRDG